MKPENPITLSSLGIQFLIIATPIKDPYAPKYSKPNSSSVVPMLCSYVGYGAGEKSMPLNSTSCCLEAFSEI